MDQGTIASNRINGVASNDGFLPSSYLIGVEISVLIVAICKTRPLIILGAPIINDIAPNLQKALWISIFYCFTSLGFAAGYIYGEFAGKHINLFIEGPRNVEICNEEGTCDQEHKNFKSQIKLNLVKISQDMKLICNKNFILNNLGLVIYTFVFGAYSFWTPRQDIYSTT
ncbi:hypothetical protein G4B88_010450 [Cannabis sativa]|uniref:Uncharacterized protein n=1 Tax=Cannabis sativa TaxID=3483 RepID=A0A7J6I7K9_CANSA|nr:hypothetical protein G4B88_010450 [Cannabis sativa]